MNHIIVVLGNRDPVIYNARASNAIRLFREKILTSKYVYLLPKFYENSWTLSTFEISLGIYKENILTDKVSDYYRHPSTHDTINEALGVRFVLENNFGGSNAVLTVVTSKCHEKRSMWIFQNIFKDLSWVILEFDSSIMTFSEIKLNRNEIEKNILKSQVETVSRYNGIYNFINQQNLAKNYTYYYFQEEHEKYKLIYNPTF